MAVGGGIRVRIAAARARALPVWILVAYVGLVNAAFVAIAVVTGNDLTLASRYCFLAMPALIPLVAIGVSDPIGRDDPSGSLFGAGVRRLSRIVLIVGAGVTTALDVVRLNDMAYAATSEAVRLMTERSRAPTVVVLARCEPADVGRLMALAWEARRLAEDEPSPVVMPRYMLVEARGADDDAAGASTIADALAAVPTPSDVWFVNIPRVPESLPSGARFGVERSRAATDLTLTHVVWEGSQRQSPEATKPAQ